MGDRVYIKTFEQWPPDEAIKEWVDATGAEVRDLRVYEAGDDRPVCTVFYVKPDTEPEPTIGEPVPLSPNAVAPTVEVMRVVGKTRRPAQAMAGIFGVIEGMRLVPDDICVAPVPLLSPDFNIRPYADMFGNIPESDDDDRETARPRLEQEVPLLDHSQ